METLCCPLQKEGVQHGLQNSKSELVDRKVPDNGRAGEGMEVCCECGVTGCGGLFRRFYLLVSTGGKLHVSRQ